MAMRFRNAEDAFLDFVDGEPGCRDGEAHDDFGKDRVVGGMLIVRASYKSSPRGTRDA
jgi:hypothetical protein